MFGLTFEEGLDLYFECKMKFIKNSFSLDVDNDSCLLCKTNHLLICKFSAYGF